MSSLYFADYNEIENFTFGGIVWTSHSPNKGCEILYVLSSYFLEHEIEIFSDATSS